MNDILRKAEEETRKQLASVQDASRTMFEMTSTAIRLGREYQVDPRIVAAMLGENLRQEKAARQNPFAR